MVDFDRITFSENIMGGRACIRGMRIGKLGTGTIFSIFLVFSRIMAVDYS